MRVMHLFHTYLTNSENWILRLLENVSDLNILVGAENFINGDHYPARFEYIIFPLRRITDTKFATFARLCNGAIGWLLKLLFPWYVFITVRNIDLIHSHFSLIGWRYRRVARYLGVPHVVSFYGFDYEQLPYRKQIWRKRYKQMFTEIDLFICEGKEAAKLLERIGCPYEKIRIVRLGVDLNKVPFFHRHKNSGKLELLQIARLTAKKGHRFTVAAFIKALEECPNMRLTLVGAAKPGEEVLIESELRCMLRGTIAAEKVTFVHQIDFAQIYGYMKSFDVFIHPSIYTEDMDSEGGAPVVILDAEATGMPVISTLHCDIPDEVVHGKTGLLAPEGDVEQLVKYICQFYWMGGDEYGRFSKAAREHVELHYDISKNAAGLRNIYKELKGGLG